MVFIVCVPCGITIDHSFGVRSQVNSAYKRQKAHPFGWASRGLRLRSLVGAGKGITLTLSGIDPTLLQGILNEFQAGLPAIVTLGVFDGNGALIGDPVCCFAGRMDQPTLDVTGIAASIAINCENRLVEMNVAVDRRYTDEDQQLDYPGDRGFEFVNSIQEAQIYWGRTPSSKNNL